MSNFLENPVFICGHRKTGTTLLINLFDGIKDALVYPDDSGFFYLYYPRYDSNSFTDDEKISRLTDVLINEVLNSVILQTNCTSSEKEALLAKQKKFYSLLKSYNKQNFSTKNILTYYIKSFREIFYPKLDPKIWIEKTTSTEIYALELTKMFPKAKFVHIVRDPRDNWASLKSGWEKRYNKYNDDIKRLLQSLIERGKLGMQFGKYNMETIGKSRYHIVRFEDLTTNPHEKMEELSEFIGVEFDSSLLKPSTFGYQWQGNNFDGNKFNRPSNFNVARWRKRISEEDAQLIEFHFDNILAYYNYNSFFSENEKQTAAANHYKWFNFSTPYSAK